MEEKRYKALRDAATRKYGRLSVCEQVSIRRKLIPPITD